MSRYTENPFDGHTDARTVLSDAHYFFLGNGYISAAVQLTPEAGASSPGLLLMQPRVFGRKRDALSFNPEHGLSATMLTVTQAGRALRSNEYAHEGAWSTVEGVPAVRLQSRLHDLEIAEYFYCPDRSTARLMRRISVRNLSRHKQQLCISSGLCDSRVEMPLELAAGAACRFSLQYILEQSGAVWQARMHVCKQDGVSPEAQEYWRHCARLDFPNADRWAYMFRAANTQISANIAYNGRADASIWQYNLEWVRDQSMIALGLTLGGHFAAAATLLRRMLGEFVSPAGDTIDSGQHRPTEEIELDQNGELLYALCIYTNWSGDSSIAREYWHKVRLCADFPLKSIFQHGPSGLLCNRREYWERSAVHGVEPGMELAYQFFVSMGLRYAARLAGRLGESNDARRWETAARKLQEAMLAHPHHGLVDNGRLIKRRAVNGAVVHTLHPPDKNRIPPGVPLRCDDTHYVNPDASTALPIAFGFIEPHSPLAHRTLDALETLWNQRWSGGGYGRYHVSSEPDSPGPWPFASLFIARANLDAGRPHHALKVLEWLAALPGARSGTWFEFYGPRPIPPCPQIGIVPWHWAEIVVFYIQHVIGVRHEGDVIVIRPRLLPGMECANADLRIARGRLTIHIQRSPQAASTYTLAANTAPLPADGLRFAPEDRNIDIRIVMGTEKQTQ